MKKVIIYPHLDPYYSSFYIYGMEQLFGKKNISYSTKGFENLPDDIWSVYLCFIIINDVGNITRYVIDSNDYNTVKSGMYEWCDVYGHCNANFELYPKDKYTKLVSLCPSFGIKCWGVVETFYRLITNLCKLHFQAKPSVKRLVGRYVKQLLREPYTAYINNQLIKENYIFFCSTLWYNNTEVNNDEGLNRVRTVFIDACRSVQNVIFEGGLVPRRRSYKQKHKFLQYLTKPVSHKDYLKKIKNSVLVFNTPAFWNCHGWKLGEYMALGKCVVSTSLSNNLPTPIDDEFVLNNYMCFVELNEKDIYKTVQYIISHPEYQQKLSMNLLKYWKEYGTPIASLRLLGIQK